MPISKVTIASVHNRTHGKGYDVILSPPFPSNASSLVSLLITFNALVASLCDQAAKQRFPVLLTWRDGRYGAEVVHVETEAA